jgi:very-short-patch-repair endonuclease
MAKNGGGSVELFILAAFIVGILALAVRELTRRSALERGAAEWPFYAKKVLTSPEQVLYHRLVKALPDHMVLAQIQLSRVLGVKRGFNFAAWNNRINRLSLDFLVCRKDSSVVAAIELDDSSHDRPDRREADARKAWALKSAGIRLIRWSTVALPDDAAIRAAVTGKSEAPVVDDGVVLEQRIEPR